MFGKLFGRDKTEKQSKSDKKSKSDTKQNKVVSAYKYLSKNVKENACTEDLYGD